MVLRQTWFAAIGVAALAWSGMSAAQQYRPDEFLKLDLPSAVLSPKPLGPAATFTPGPLLRAATNGHRVAHAHVERPTHAPRTAVALHRRNPVDAQASDARIQVWPCRSGGICNWKR